PVLHGGCPEVRAGQQGERATPATPHAPSARRTIREPRQGEGGALQVRPEDPRGREAVDIRSERARGTTSPISSERVPMATWRFIQELDGLGGEWTRLAMRATNVFGTWEWASAWRKHIQPNAPTVTTVISRGEVPIAVVPLQRTSSKLVRVVRLAGHDVAD